MRSWLNVRRAVMVAVLLAVVGGGVAAFAIFGDDDELPSGVVLKVGSTVVTRDDLANRVRVLSAVYGVTVPAKSSDRREFDRQSAKAMAISLVVHQQARAAGIVVARPTAQAELDKLIDSQLGGDQQAFVDYLANQGVTQGEVLDEITRTLELDRLYDKVTADVAAVTDTEVSTEFARRKNELAAPAKRALSNIVVAGRTDAQAVLRQLHAGEPFAKVAKASSLDEATRASGGSLGLVSADQLEADFGRAAFAGRLGVPFGPVRSSHGWNVGVVTRIVPGKPATYAAVAPQLRAEMNLRARATLWQSWLRKRIEAAHVRYADAYRPEDPLTPLTPTISPSPTVQTDAPDTTSSDKVVR